MIENELSHIIEVASKFGKKISKETAFDILSLQFLCFKDSNLEEVWFDLTNCITDGSNDGGIDFVFYDEDENKVIIGQNKYSESISTEDFTTEINKIIRTLNDFNKSQTGKYNNLVKEKLQNALDRQTEESLGNVDIYFSTISKFNEDKAMSKIAEIENQVNQINIFLKDDLEEIIEKVHSNFVTVVEYDLHLDEANNVLKYSTENQEGIIVNISSNSLTKLYNNFHTKGLFNLNIRRYIRSKKVDEGIQDTLNKDRDNFWFLNNGLTIACEDYNVTGNKVRLYDFSIVNGGQTTTLIGTYKGSNEKEFYIPCKILKSKEDMVTSKKMDFYNKIAEATNSQKPIQPRDLRSNSREMIALKNILAKRNVGLEIKRGEKPEKRKFRIKNDEFAQLIYSFVYQKPGTARSNKKSLFDNNKSYSTIFRKNHKNKELIDFYEDIVVLNDWFQSISKKFKEDMPAYMNSEKAVIFSNGKMTLFGLFGIVYRLVNGDVKKSDFNLDDDPLDSEIIYGSFISNYKKDDISEKLSEMILFLVDIVEQDYFIQYNNKKVTSVSNFLKTDNKFKDIIVKSFISNIKRKRNYEELMDYAEIFLRSK